MDRSNIEKIAHTPEDKVLLAQVWDKIHSAMQKNIPTATGFLSLREQELAKYLLGKQPGLYAYGGYPEAERKALVYLPEYMDESALSGEDSPVVCLQADFYEADTPSHRDFLGALMGAGIARSAVGDICVGRGQCHFFVSARIAPYLLQNFTSAGRTRVRLQQIPPQQLQLAQPETQSIQDTLASVRLDSVISAGFRIPRSLAAQHITAGKAAINGLPCEKPDKPVEQGDTVSVRGLGKIRLTTVGGQSKKGRTCVVIDRYI